jgi:hypothetical protein
MNNGEGRWLGLRRTLDLSGCSPSRSAEECGEAQPGRQPPIHPGLFSEREYRQDGLCARDRFLAFPGDIPCLQTGAVLQ